MSDQLIQELAREAAPARMAELQAKMKEITDLFPDLAAVNSGGANGTAHAESGAGAEVVNKPRRKAMTRRAKRSKMSRKQRAAVSVRMKKYWKGRRQESEAQSA